MGNNLNYIKTSLLLNLKQTFEYKVNVYFNILTSLSFLFMHMFFVFLFQSNFPTILDWGVEEILFFVFISQFVFQFTAAFMYYTNLTLELLKGTVNLYLTRPTNVYLQQFLTSSKLRPIVMSIFYMTAIFVLIVYFRIRISFIELIMSLFMLFVSCLFLILLMRFIDSLSFHMKANKALIRNIFKDVTNTLHAYPATMFSNTSLRYVLLLLPQVYYSAYLTRVFFGYVSYDEYLFLIGIEILLSSVLALGIWINWHYGLKKYEAFG